MSTALDKNTDTKWFLQFNGQVQGPFNPDSLQVTIQSLGYENSENALVWKRGLTDWVKASQWKASDYKNMQFTAPALGDQDGNTHTQAHNTTNSDLFETTFSHTFTEGAFYRVQISFVDQPLMSKAELMTLIAKQQDVSKVSIQDPNTKDWKDVYAFPDIVERLGLSRRKQLRVPILAQFTGKSNKNAEATYRVITISQGGMGFTENYDLKIGDEVEGQISSPHFFQSLSVKAEVIYAGQDGYIGLKFSAVPDEAKAAIIEYVKRFGKITDNTPS
jgi:hypothetical protein